MKIYTNTYDLAMPSANKFWVAPNSDFKIGIKVELRGQAYAGSFTLKQNGQTVTADEDKTAGFTTYTIKSGGPGSVIYTVDVPDAQQKFTLVQVVTDSTVFDVGGGGGDVPADVATKSWVESQISDFVEEDALTAYATVDSLSGYAQTDDLTAYYTKTETSSAADISTALEGKQPAGNYLTAETEPAFATMSADIVVDGDLTAYYTKTETSSAAELADAFAGAGGGGAISAFDLSQNPVWSKTQVEEAVNNNICLPQTIFQLENNTLSVADIVGDFNVNSAAGATSGNRVKKLIVGTNVSAVASTINDYNRLQEIVLPESLAQIKANAFINGGNKYCIINIPNSVSAIDNPRYLAAGASTNGYRYMDFGNTRTSVPTIGAAAGVSPDCKYYVPDSLYDTWIAASGWNNISAQIHRHSELEAPYLYTSKVAGGAETGTTGTPAAVNAVKSVYETDWATLSATADANTFYIVLADPE